jgi:hypothetical protein
VEEHRAAGASRPVGDRVPGDRRPHLVSPLNGPVQQTDELWTRRIGRRLVANVCVRASPITIGMQIDTPQRRPSSRSQSAWASLKSSCARCLRSLRSINRQEVDDAVTSGWPMTTYATIRSLRCAIQTRRSRRTCTFSGQARSPAEKGSTPMIPRTTASRRRARQTRMPSIWRPARSSG